MKNFRLTLVFLVFTGIIQPKTLLAQRYLADIDSSFFIKDTVRPVIKRFENLRITGYIQPQFQKAQSDGAPSYTGGNFSQFSSSRFMLRRARVKIDYVLPSKSRYPKALFFLSDWRHGKREWLHGRMFWNCFENQKERFLSLTTGLCPAFLIWGQLSSAFRETPERGRMFRSWCLPSWDIWVDAGLMNHRKEINKAVDIKL